MFGALATMFTAVGRRSVEIATLRALGFHAVPVVTSVLVEATALALAGGILGAGIAYAALDGYTASTLNPASASQLAFAFRVTPEAIRLGLGWAIALGVIGGTAPARRAARLPIHRPAGILSVPGGSSGNTNPDIIMAASLDEPQIDRSRGGRPRFVRLIRAVAVVSVLSGGGAAGLRWWDEARVPAVRSAVVRQTLPVDGQPTVTTVLNRGSLARRLRDHAACPCWPGGAGAGLAVVMC